MSRFELIWEYLRKGKTGKKANLLERMALKDPFLQEALEGMEGIQGEHEYIVRGLRRKIKHTHPGSRVFYWAVAVALLSGGIAVSILYKPVDPSSLAVVQLQVDSPGESGQENTSLDTVVEKVVKDAELSRKIVAYSRSRKNGKGQYPETAVEVSDECQEDTIPASAESDCVNGKQKIPLQKKWTTPAVNSHILKDTTGFSGVTVTGCSAGQDTVHTIRKKRQKRRNISMLEQQKKLRQDWQEDFRQYVADSLRYPEAERMQHLEGEVVLSVHLNKRQRPSRIKVIHKLSPACDREARRLVEEYPGIWSSEVSDFTVSVRFSLKASD